LDANSKQQPYMQFRDHAEPILRQVFGADFEERIRVRRLALLAVSRL
jgi:hypothetical protein